MSIFVLFKEVYTTRILGLHLDPQMTVCEFMNSSRDTLSSYFGINNHDMQLVVCGQVLAEAGHALIPSPQKLSDIWGEQLRHLSFYVRRKNYEYNHQLQNHFFTPRIEDNECPVCFTVSELSRPYACAHGICAQCYHGCRMASIINCCLCRSV